MSSRRPAGISAIVGAVLWLVPTLSAGQRSESSSAAVKSWTPPRTPDGQPDLQGYWTNDTFTPLERPADLTGKEVFTDEEAAAYLQKRVEQFLGQSKTDIHYDDAIWQGENVTREPNRRTSLIVDPPDGKVPALTPEAAKRAAVGAETRRSMGPTVPMSGRWPSGAFPGGMSDPR